MSQHWEGMMITIDANQLRWLAEAADGKRGVPLVLAILESGKVDVIETAKVKSSDKVLLALETPSRGPGVQGDARVRVFWNDRIYDPSRHLAAPDALFVTQSAIQKFLLPYYMRFKSGAQVQAIENKLFNTAHVKAAIHIPPSNEHPFSPFGRVGCICPTEGSDELIVDLTED